MSRIISNECIKEAKSWRIPEVNHVFDHQEGSYNVGFGGICEQIPTLKDIDNMKKNAYDAGFKDGYADGMEIAKEEFDKKSIAANALLKRLNEISADIDDEVKSELLELSILLAKQVIQAEISIHPDKILKVLNSAIDVLPSAHSSLDIVINPEDAPAIQQFLSSSTEMQNRGWSLIEDADIERGGCKVVSNNSCVDASVANRVEKAAANLFADLA